MTIFFDVTDIVQFAAANSTVSGIQRGVLRIIGAAYEQSMDVGGILKHPLTGEFVGANLSFLAGGYNYNRNDFLSRVDANDTRAIWLCKKLRKHQPGSLRHTTAKIISSARLKLDKRLQKKLIVTEKKPSCISKLALKPGDHLVTLGDWWIDYVGLHGLAVRNGCSTAAFVHDIFPISMGSKAAKDFEPWLMYCAKNYNKLLCNSEFTKQEVAAFLETRGLRPHIEVVLYPHEFSTPRFDVGSREYVLCVGTQSDRKNIRGLIGSWADVARVLGDGTPTLVIAGARTKETALCETAPHVTFIERPDDAMLERLYQGCLFTVFPSICEGWGIPIGESLWFGKPVLCANTSSMPEVGGKYADYYSLDDPTGLSDGILNMIRYPRALPDNIRSELRAWRDTSSDLLGAIQASPC
jgi:glycosyltransferase involved in cell wall biosynthesis